MLGYTAIVPTWDIFTCPACTMSPTWQSTCLAASCPEISHPQCSQQSPRPFFKRKLWSVKRLCRRLPRNPFLARQTPSLLPFSPQITAKAQVMAMFSGVFADNSLLDGNAFICLGLVYLSRVGLSGGWSWGQVPALPYICCYYCCHCHSHNNPVK